MRTDTQTRQALQEVENLWKKAEIHRKEATDAAKYLLNECYSIYWDGVPHDRHQICALASALMHQADTMLESFLEYDKILRSIQEELKYPDAKTIEFCFL